MARGAGTMRGMRVLVVYCHPSPESYCRAVLERVLAGLGANGHEVDVIDLYAEGFDPVLGGDEWRTYMRAPEELIAGQVADHVARLRRAEGLVFVYPTWTFALPAMLKGWMDRVFVPGVAFALPRDGERAVRSLLRHIRLVAGVTTTGSPRWVMALSGFPGKRIIRRAIRLGFAPRCQNVWLCLHGVDTVSRAARVAHLERVERRFRRVR